MKSNLKNIQIQTNPLPMRSWKTSNQVLCFQSCLTIVIISFSVIISSTLMDYSYIYLKEISQQVFEQETRHQVKMNSLGQHRQTIQYFQQGKQSLSCINDLYQFLQRYHISSQPATDCLFPEHNSLGETIDQFCYGVPIPIKENITDEHNFRELNSLLNAYQTVLELSKLTFCTFRGESQIFFAHALTMPSAYRPHIRPWYTNHVKAVESLPETNQTILISSPYITFKTSVIQITQTMSLLQLNGYFDGTVAVDSKVPELPQQALDQAQPIIVNENGDLLTTKINEIIATQIFKFYQTNYTGFTEEDWELLKSCSNDNDFVIIDLFNRIKNMNVFISAIKLKDYYLFMFINDNYFTSQIQDIFKSIEQFYKAQYIIIALISILFSILAIIFQIVIIKYVFLQDFNQLSQVAEKQIFKNQIQQTLRIRTNSVEIRQLFKSYYQAVDKMTNNTTNTKNKTCTIIEQIKYPKPFRFFRLDMRILDNLQDTQIKNYEKSPYFRLVIQCFKQLFEKKIYKFLR